MSDLKEILITPAIFVAAGIFFLIVSWAGYKQKWRDSGYPCRWEIIGGCQIQMKDGRWIPANRYREISP